MYTVSMITVTVAGSGEPQLGQQSYSLTCTFTGTTSSASRYRWLKNGIPVESEIAQTLSFSPLQLSDAGLYTCEVTINSVVRTGNYSISIQSKLRLLDGHI